MKSIGKTLREARIRRGMTREKLSWETKIKPSFIGAIESENWESLPEFPVVLGFVRNLAKILDYSEERMVALLRRDYPPKKLFINPKPDLKERFVWGPRLSLLLGSVLILILVISYLGFQYMNFVALPELVVDSPKINEKIEVGMLEVKGRTEKDASVSVNDQPVLVNEKGEFKSEIEVSDKLMEIVVVSKTRAGKETKVKVPVMIK